MPSPSGVKRPRQDRGLSSDETDDEAPFSRPAKMPTTRPRSALEMAQREGRKKKRRVKLPQSSDDSRALQEALHSHREAANTIERWIRRRTFDEDTEFWRSCVTDCMAGLLTLVPREYATDVLLDFAEVVKKYTKLAAERNTPTASPAAATTSPATATTSPATVTHTHPHPAPSLSVATVGQGGSRTSPTGLNTTSSSTRLFTVSLTPEQLLMLQQLMPQRQEE